MALERAVIIEHVVARLEPRPDVHALWECGSAAFGLDDEWSDIDLSVIADDGAVAEVFAEIEAALAALSPIELVWRVPEPTWHGITQRFYRLTEAGPYRLVDVGILERSNERRFLEPEQHGHARVLFDKASLSVPPPFDEPTFRARMKRDLEDARTRFEMLQSLVDKELRRGHLLDAVAFYQSLTLRPLLMVLGMQHRPLRYDFGARYVGRELPRGVVRELEELHLVRDAVDLAAKLLRAQALFRRTVAALDIDSLPLAALSARSRSPTG